MCVCLCEFKTEGQNNVVLVPKWGRSCVLPSSDEWGVMGVREQTKRPFIATVTAGRIEKQFTQLSMLFTTAPHFSVFSLPAVSPSIISGLLFLPQERISNTPTGYH